MQSVDENVWRLKDHPPTDVGQPPTENTKTHWHKLPEQSSQVKSSQLVF